MRFLIGRPLRWLAGFAIHDVADAHRSDRRDDERRLRFIRRIVGDADGGSNQSGPRRTRNRFSRTGRGQQDARQSHRGRLEESRRFHQRGSEADNRTGLEGRTSHDVCDDESRPGLVGQVKTCRSFRARRRRDRYRSSPPFPRPDLRSAERIQSSIRRASTPSRG